MTESSELRPRTQAQPRGAVDITIHVSVAAWHIHRAICRQTGSDQDWDTATPQHRAKLRAAVIRIIEDGQ